MRVRSERDLSWWPVDCLAGGKPRAAIDNHPAWHTLIFYYVERDVFAVSVEVILSRTIATARSTTHREFNFFTLGLPTSVEFGPAFAFECERTRRIEARHKGAER